MNSAAPVGFRTGQHQRVAVFGLAEERAAVGAGQRGIECRDIRNHDVDGRGRKRRAGLRGGSEVGKHEGESKGRAQRAPRESIPGGA